MLCGNGALGRPADAAADQPTSCLAEDLFRLSDL